tara:strand:- start:340 stop:531 length:192 start_codon:yes stop_codon:yes gene_type:complete
MFIPRCLRHSDPLRLHCYLDKADYVFILQAAIKRPFCTSLDKCFFFFSIESRSAKTKQEFLCL